MIHATAEPGPKSDKWSQQVTERKQADNATSKPDFGGRAVPTGAKTPEIIPRPTTKEIAAGVPGTEGFRKSGPNTADQSQH